MTGLQQSLVAHLKGFVKALDSHVHKETSLVLIPAYFVYLQAYYHQMSKQVQPLLFSWLQNNIYTRSYHVLLLCTASDVRGTGADPGNKYYIINLSYPNVVICANKC